MSVKKRTVKSVKKQQVKVRYALVDAKTFLSDSKESENNVYLASDAKKDPNHTINSYLRHAGDEEDLKELAIVKLEYVGKPVVKTVRDIKIV